MIFTMQYSRLDVSTRAGHGIYSLHILVQLDPLVSVRFIAPYYEVRQHYGQPYALKLYL
jgi:hypothetical protein